jgi:hypothetical protein
MRTIKILVVLWMSVPLAAQKAKPVMVQTHAGFQSVVISNVKPRRDTEGRIVDAHDGSLEYFQGRYYLYGTHYGKTNGLGKTNYYVCYSSPDLIRWKYEGRLLSDREPRTYYRPYVKFNRLTGKYVLWYNADNEYGVAISDWPGGPFRIVNPNVPLKYSTGGVGDFGFFVDTDGSGYIVYVAHVTAKMETAAVAAPQHHQISVEKLTPNFLSSTFQNSGFIAGNVEAPALFRRDGLYYLLFDNTCAFCAIGSGVRTYTSSTVMGPYTYQGNINILPSDAALGQSWTVPGTGRADTILHAQQTDVAGLPSATGPVYLWVGDRWGSTPDGIKGHDFQVWVPLQFTDHRVLPLRNLGDWQIESRFVAIEEDSHR